MRFYKLQNGNKYDLTAVATSLYDLIGEDLPEYLNYVVIQNTGGSDVRYLLNGNTPDDTNGFILKAGETVNYSIVNLRRLLMLSPGGAGSVQIMVGESNDDKGFDFQSVSTGGGGGAEGALIAANNLSDIPNDALARTNIGLGNSSTLDAGSDVGEVVLMGDDGNGNSQYPAGDGSLLTNITIPDLYLTKDDNLASVADASQARANIGAGTGDGDMLGSNNLSELTDTNQAKTNLGVDFYPNNEVLKFGRNIVSPTMRIGTVANPDGSLVTRIQYQNDGDGLVNHLQIGTNDSVFDNFDPAYTTNNFSDIPGVILRSNDPNVNLGLFPRLTNGNQSFMLTGPAGIRVVADTAGGPGVMQLGQGGASAVLNLSGNSGQNNRVVCANGTGHSLYLTRTVGAAIVKASDATAPPAPFYTTCGHVVPNTILANTDYELDANDYLITYVQLDAPFTLTIPKLINLLGNSNTGTPLTDRTFIFVIKDGTGNASVNPVTIQSIEGLPFDGAPNYVLNRDYGAVTLMVCAVNNFAKILVINEI